MSLQLGWGMPECLPLASVCQPYTGWQRLGIYVLLVCQHRYRGAAGWLRFHHR